jgi:protein-arginine kinase activator protein McsA
VALFGRGGFTTNACTECPIGFAASLQYNRDGAHENDIHTNGIVVCGKCSVHEYSTQQGQEQCKTCPGGYRALSPNLNTLGCEECPDGKFSQYPNPGFTCEDALCDAGNYYDVQSDPENPACASCPAGFYQTHRRATECSECPAGFEAATQGSQACT